MRTEDPMPPSYMWERIVAILDSGNEPTQNMQPRKQQSFFAPGLLLMTFVLLLLFLALSY